MKENNIEVDYVEIGCYSVDWIDLAEDGVQRRAVMNTVMKYVVT
jgi:hypothetical protein